MSLERIGATLRSLVTRAIVRQSGVGARIIIQVSGLDKEVFAAELLHPPGYSGRPKAGADVVLLQVMGTRDHLVALGGDGLGESIPDLSEGEAGIAAFGNRVVVRNNRLEITSNNLPIIVTASTTIALNAPNVSTTGNLTVGTGATGTFTAASGQTITVNDGIITNIY